MDIRIEINNVIYTPKSGTHERLHTDAQELCRELGVSSYRVIWISVEAVSDSFNA